MVDAHALGACGLGRAGSNPASPTSFGTCLRTEFASTGCMRPILRHAIEGLYIATSLSGQGKVD